MAGLLRKRGRRILVAAASATAVIALALGGYALFFLSRYPRVDPARWPGTWPCTGEGTEKRLQSLLDEYSNETDGVALQVTVISPDGTEWSGVAGYADLENKVGVTLEHGLLIGSATKMFTSAMVLREVERGTIGLGAPVSTWVEGLPYGDQVTVRMLLAQRSGIPNYTDDTWFRVRYFDRPNKRWAPLEILDVFKDKPLVFDSDSRFEYSNSNYVLLGIILEETTGKTYDELVAQLASDLGLEDTYYLVSPPGDEVTHGYDEARLNLGRRDISKGLVSFATGAFSSAGIVSDSEDIAHYVRELLEGDVLSEESLDTMLTFSETEPFGIEPQTGYGLGLRRWEIDGWTWIGHTGSVPGFSSVAMHAPEQGYTVVVLSNLSSIGQADILTRIQGVLATPEE